MFTLFNPQFQNELIIIYSKLLPKDLFTLATTSSPLIRKEAIEFLFKQHTAEAIKYQLKLLQTNSLYLPDETVIRAAMAYYAPEMYLKTLFSLLRARYKEEVTFRETLPLDTSFCEPYVPIEHYLLNVAYNAVLLTDEQLTKFVKYFQTKFYSIKSEIACYVVQNIAPLMTLLDVKTLFKATFLSECSGILGRYLQERMVLKDQAKNPVSDQKKFFLLGSLAPIMAPDYQRDVLGSILNASWNNLTEARPFLKSVVPKMSAAQLDEILKPCFRNALAEDKFFYNYHVEFAAAVLEYVVDGGLLKPYISQLFPYLLYLKPNTLKLKINCNFDLLQTPKITLNAENCRIALKLLLKMVAHAFPGQLLPLLPFVRAGTNHEAVDISIVSRKLLTLLMMRLGVHYVTENDALLMLDSLKMDMVYKTFDPKAVRPFQQFLAFLSGSLRQDAVKRVLLMFFCEEEHIASSEAVLQAWITILEPYLRSVHSQALLEEYLNNFFNQTHNEYKHKFLQRFTLCIPFLLSISLAEFFDRIKTFPVSKGLLNSFQTLIPKMPPNQREELYLILHDNYHQWECMYAEHIWGNWVAFFPYLSDSRRIDIFKLLFSKKLNLDLKIIQPLYVYVSVDSIAYGIQCLLEFIQNNDSDGLTQKWALFSNLGPRLDAKQQKLVLNTIEMYLKTWNDSIEMNQMVRALKALIPYFTQALDSSTRLDVFNQNIDHNPAAFFPVFLELSEPNSAVCPNSELLKQLQKEHQLYLHCIISWINDPNFKMKMYEREELPYQGNIYTYPHSDRYRVLHMLLQWAAKNPVRFSSFKNEILAADKKEKNTPEFHTLKHVVQMEELLEASFAPNKSDVLSVVPAFGLKN